MKGMKNKKSINIVLDARIEGIGETIDKDTGVPPSVVSQMILNGKISSPGVYPPELVVPEEDFFKELAKRKIYIYLDDKRLNEI